MTTYRSISVEGQNIFYREAGPTEAPTIVLLHGFPSSSYKCHFALEEDHEVIAAHIRRFLTERLPTAGR